MPTASRKKGPGTAGARPATNPQSRGAAGGAAPPAGSPGNGERPLTAKQRTIPLFEMGPPLAQKQTDRQRLAAEGIQPTRQMVLAGFWWAEARGHLVPLGEWRVWKAGGSKPAAICGALPDDVQGDWRLVGKSAQMCQSCLAMSKDSILVLWAGGRQ